ncbi:hypothetical protein GPJ56_007296 [Histomonas meleagridis]|uniref:Uncharacterized protein n=1 Tax=Histomonas meleagridis TaxID=135588 RepID=UPI00355AB0AF|nr:hypothetical protein GPJ56_007296 [Histomonas meleagridis]KAH0804142.1 Uncharacterized protein GO595_002972 [Histomonas meleagridis]
MPEELRVGRDYQMFAVMANVRNDDENELEIISESRGIPNDVSKEVMEEVVRWSGDAHSHSYLKLNELVQYQKNFQPKKMSGMISLEEMEQFDEFGITPYYIYQDNRYDNFDLVWREWETKCPIDKLVEAIKKQVDKIGVIPLWQWEEDPNGAYNNSSNIRIVFWFDN